MSKEEAKESEHRRKDTPEEVSPEKCFHSSEPWSLLP